MKRYVKERTHRQEAVKQVEVSTKHKKLRIILFVLCVVVALACFAVAMVFLLRVEPGWTQLTVDSVEDNNGGEFNFYYYFGEDDDNNYRKSVQAAYTEADVYAYNVFCESYLIDSTKNLYYINRHPNQEIQVPSLLYRSLKAFEDSGSRFLYYAPIYEAYKSLVASDNDDTAKMFDLHYNEELGEYADALISYIEDEEHVRIEFYENDVIKLVVSEEYMSAFSEEKPLYVDFCWTKNAFIIDYIVETMTSAGYTDGIISSVDGYARSLSNRDEAYSASVFDIVSDASDNKYVVGVGTIAYEQKLSFVTLKNYPTTTGEYGYYVYEDGTIRNLFVDFATGENISAVDSITAYSEELSCAEIAIKLIPIYLDKKLDTTKIEAVEQDGIYYIYCEDGRIKTNGDKATVVPVDRGDNTYTVENTKKDN